MSDFLEKEGSINGVGCRLIVPCYQRCNWTEDNLWNRSRVVDYGGNILSQSFGKFFNYGEKPELYPDPFEFDDWVVEDKMDGSLVAVDWVNDGVSIRTRGALSYKAQENAADFELLLEKYPVVSELVMCNPEITFLFEIVTPNNRIVLQYNEVDFYLIGAVNKEKLRYLTPQKLDMVAEAHGLKRPDKFDFKNAKGFIDEVKGWHNREGVVITYNNGQNKVKCKSDDYCWKHRILSGLESEKNLLDKFFDLRCPTYEEFFSFFEENFDYEIAYSLRDRLFSITQSYREVQEDLGKMEGVLEKIKLFPTRKEQAEEICLRFSDWRKACAFSMLDEKEIDLKKVMQRKNAA